MNLEELYGEYAEKNTVKAIIFFCKNDEAIEIGSDFVPCLSVNEIETSIGRYGDPYAIKAAQAGNCGFLILKEALLMMVVVAH